MISAIIASIPVAGAGFFEDITNRISPRIRLSFAILSGLLFVGISGIHVTDIQFPGLNYLFSFAPTAIILTALSLAGISNAVNIIDGYNGLAAGSVSIIFLALALVAYRLEDPVMLQFSLVNLAVTVGFLVVNFPFGRLFLGDGGAYYLGFALGINVIGLFERNSELSPWTAILFLLYPIVETLFSIVRRATTHGQRPDQADRIHFHHLLYRGWVLPLLNKLNHPRYANSLTGLLMWSLPLICVIAGHIGIGRIWVSVALVFWLIITYIACYLLLARYALNRGKKRK